MDRSKVSPQEIYEVLEEQKKLQEVKSKLLGMLNKVNQTINSLTVINKKYLISLRKYLIRE